MEAAVNRRLVVAYGALLVVIAPAADESLLDSRRVNQFLIKFFK